MTRESDDADGGEEADDPGDGSGPPALTPADPAAARAAYESVGEPAREVVRETARAMSFDRAEYRERVTGDVVASARDALFAALLAVRHGDRAAFDEWVAARDLDVSLAGSEDVDRVAWHPAPAGGVVVAATYQNEPEAAASAVRRRAFGEVYRPLFEDADEGDAGD